MYIYVSIYLSFFLSFYVSIYLSIYPLQGSGLTLNPNLEAMITEGEVIGDENELGAILKVCDG